MKGTIIRGKERKREGGKKNERCVDRKMAGSYSGRLSYKPAPDGDEDDVCAISIRCSQA